MKTIAILGSTGSIGTQALDLVRRLTAGLPLRHARALTAEEALAGDAALWAGPAPEGED